MPSYAAVHPWLQFGLLAVVLAVAAYTDLRTGKVYNWLTYPAMLLGLGLAGFGGWMLASDPAYHGPAEGGFRAAMTASSVGLFAGLIPFGIIFLAGALGGGDAKLMGAVGAITASWQAVLGTAVYALILAFLLAVVLMFRHRIVLRTLRNVWLAATSMMVKVKPTLDPTAPRIPFGVAIKIGGLLAAAEHVLHYRLPWSGYFS